MDSQGQARKCIVGSKSRLKSNLVAQCFIIGSCPGPQLPRRHLRVVLPLSLEGTSKFALVLVKPSLKLNHWSILSQLIMRLSFVGNLLWALSGEPLLSCSLISERAPILLSLTTRFVVTAISELVLSTFTAVMWTHACFRPATSSSLLLLRFSFFISVFILLSVVSPQFSLWFVVPYLSLLLRVSLPYFLLLCLQRRFGCFSEIASHPTPSGPWSSAPSVLILSVINSLVKPPSPTHP